MALDDVEDIVKIVRYSAGKGADAFQLLRLQKLFLKFFTLRYGREKLDSPL